MKVVELLAASVPASDCSVPVQVSRTRLQLRQNGRDTEAMYTVDPITITEAMGRNTVPYQPLRPSRLPENGRCLASRPKPNKCATRGNKPG